MAWNRPTSNTVDATPSSRPSGRGKMPRLRRGLIAGAIVVLGAGLAVWLLTNGEAASSPLQKKDRGRIRDVKPATVSTNGTPTAAATDAASGTNAVAVKPMTPEEERVWRIHHPAFTNRASRWNTSRVNRIFSNGIDRKIATLLDLRPGETLVGDSSMFFREDFTRRFLKSLTEPIIVTKDDSPEDAALKRAVNATKIELKARYDAGEDIRELMIQTRKDMQNLALYRRDLSQELVKISADRSLTEDEMNKVLEKANSLLAERGAEPLAMPRFAAQRFELLRQKGELGAPPTPSRKQ